jgi:hypothetical protein
LIVVVLVLLASISGFALATDTPDADASKSMLNLIPKDQVKPVADLGFRLGDRLVVTATGTSAGDIEKAIKSNPATALSLYLDGTKLPGIPVGVVNRTDSEIQIYFDLIRKPSDKENRAAWDALFTQNSGIEKTFKLSMAIGASLPLEITPELQFSVASGIVVWSVLIAGLLVLFVSFYLLTKTRALRDGLSTNFYSLGKSQMAFWGLVVVLTFSGVWIINGSMEEISNQMLILLGISGGTGLGAVIIGASKQSILNQKVIDLEKLEKELLIKHANNNATPEELSRLLQIPSERKTLLESSPTESTGSFWRDICDDGNGLSFHRLQVVIWTLVLGTIFVVSVFHVMSMPEFPGSLLILMGISNGTYLGFKIPEK